MVSDYIFSRLRIRIQKKKKKVGVNYVKDDTLDALYRRTASSSELQIQIGSSQPTADPLKKLI